MHKKERLLNISKNSQFFVSRIHTLSLVSGSRFDGHTASQSGYTITNGTILGRLFFRGVCCYTRAKKVLTHQASSLADHAVTHNAHRTKQITKLSSRLLYLVTKHG